MPRAPQDRDVAAQGFNPLGHIGLVVDPSVAEPVPFIRCCGYVSTKPDNREVAVHRCYTTTTLLTRAVYYE